MNENKKDHAVEFIYNTKRLTFNIEVKGLDMDRVFEAAARIISEQRALFQADKNVAQMGDMYSIMIHVTTQAKI